MVHFYKCNRPKVLPIFINSMNHHPRLLVWKLFVCEVIYTEWVITDRLLQCCNSISNQSRIESIDLVCLPVSIYVIRKVFFSSCGANVTKQYVSDLSYKKIIDKDFYKKVLYLLTEKSTKNTTYRPVSTANFLRICWGVKAPREVSQADYNS
jgi:hypothetical protein